MDEDELSRMTWEELETYWRDHDVRRVLPELRARGGLVVDAVPWRQYCHAYGRADDVPDLLHALSASDPAVVSRSLSDLWNKVRHQGNSSASAALTVPFLIHVAANPTTHRRADLLLLAAEAGHRNHFGRDLRQDLLHVVYPPEEKGFVEAGLPVEWTLEAARAAITADVPLLIPLLDDADVAVRSNAAYALATALTAPPVVSRALRARLAVEDDEPVRISVVLALAQLAVERSAAAGAVAWAEQLWTGEDNPIDLRFAGALGWLCATAAPPPQSLLDLLTTATTAAMEQWMQQVPWPGDIAREGSLAAWLAAFLNNAPAEEPENPFAFL
ncbi:HEAT repeat domain-containing protein [Pseudofrankia sp. BMG5.36]|uniref:HEAT repeat domain-containing protein n=1 Tax=Pseudofrankia sp. BMG5.36 TaxID=1834512 RepID=UPI0010421110|nr:HEAT repeat domain-containing protein [Pseudofrankia sp. BMG5.36]